MINVDLEAVHFYAPFEHLYAVNFSGEKEPQLPTEDTERLLTNLNLGIKLNNLLEKSFNVRRTLFIDNTAQDKKERKSVHGGDIGMRYLRPTSIVTRQIYDAGFKYNRTLLEGNLYDSGNEVIKKLKAKLRDLDGIRLNQKENKIIYHSLTNGKREKNIINLIQEDGYPDPKIDYPSCEVLDLCAYKEKLTRSDVAVTVLPESYKPQQERVKKLFEILGEKPAVIVVYHDKQGNISEISSWNETATDEVSKILSTL